MTTAIFTAAPINNNDANFRLWGKGLSDAFQTCGLIKTADTGQVDWATATAPVQNYPAFEIRRFSDALQATAPLFLKIEYGGNGAQNAVATRLSIGKGSNGAGTLTGIMLSASPSAAASSGVATGVPWYVSSADGSMIGYSAAPSLSSASVFPSPHFVIERSRANDGSPTAIGFVVVAGIGGGSNIYQVYNYTNGLLSPVNANIWPAAVPATGQTASLAAGGKAPMFPAILSDGAGNFWQPRCLITYAPSDAPSWVPVTVTGFGTYLPMGNYAFGGFANGILASSYSQPAAMAWY